MNGRPLRMVPDTVPCSRPSAQNVLAMAVGLDEDTPSAPCCVTSVSQLLTAPSGVQCGLPEHAPPVHYHGQTQKTTARQMSAHQLCANASAHSILPVKHVFLLYVRTPCASLTSTSRMASTVMAATRAVNMATFQAVLFGILGVGELW